MSILSIDLERIEKRLVVYEHGARLVARLDMLSNWNFALARPAALATAEIYFLISDFLKQETFQEPTHWTDHTKVAAITALVVAQCQPFRPNRPIDIENPVFAYANPILALRLGTDAINHKFGKRAWDDRKRFYDTLINSKLAIVDEYIEILKTGSRKIGDPFDIIIKRDDMQKIRQSINMFVVLNGIRL